MIPILFEKDTTSFATNGLGRLPDCISCIVTEERNGIYECEFQYPITGVMYPELQTGRIIVCTHDDKKEYQPFEIYQRSIPDVRGVVTFYAHHISYKLNDIVVMPFSASTVATALEKIKTYSANANPFTFWTDKDTQANYKSTVPRAGRNMLGGEENSILDVFGGGEYEFDNFTIKLYAHRGQDSGVAIRYGKNLIDLKQDIDISSCYTAIVPYWADSEGHVVTLPEKILYFGETGETVDAAVMDLSEEFENKPTVAQLRNAATSRYQRGGSWLPKENITVDFVQLWQTEEYKNFTGLQRVSLCDTVSVYYEPAGVEAVKQKVVKTVYNVLLDRYDQIELGELSTSLGQAIQNDILEIVPTTSFMEQAIQYATELIRGGLGGYVVMTPGENGYPQEILIMDTPDVNTAVNVWRFNMGGLGHSHSGYNGPYNDIALTQDGRINASMITTGVLNANIIKAGTLSDYNGNTSFNLSTGEFTMKKGSINLGNGNFTVNDSGVVAIKSGSINLGSGNFVVTDAGVLTIKKGSINLGSGNFVVTDAGKLTANSGTIGPFTIGSVKLEYSSSDRLMRISEDGWRFIKRLEYANYGYKTAGVGISYNSNDTPELSFYAKYNTTGINDVQKVAYINADNLTSKSLDIACNNSMISIGSEIMMQAKNAAYMNELHITNNEVRINANGYVLNNFSVGGTKSRKVDTKDYSDRLLYCYETPTPLFGDIGQAVLDEEGVCYVAIDDIFTETIAKKAEYQVFLQAEGEGSCWIAEKAARYFIIQGTPNMRVAWELKAKQRDYENIRLEMSDYGLETYAYYDDPLPNAEEYIREQEELLYGYN